MSQTSAFNRTIGLIETQKTIADRLFYIFSLEKVKLVDPLSPCLGLNIIFDPLGNRILAFQDLAWFSSEPFTLKDYNVLLQNKVSPECSEILIVSLSF